MHLVYWQADGAATTARLECRRSKRRHERERQTEVQTESRGTKGGMMIAFLMANPDSRESRVVIHARGGFFFLLLE